MSFSFFQALFHQALLKKFLGSPSQKEHDGDYFTHSQQTKIKKKYFNDQTTRDASLGTYTPSVRAEYTFILRNRQRDTQWVDHR